MKKILLCLVFCINGCLFFSSESPLTEGIPGRQDTSSPDFSGDIALPDIGFSDRDLPDVDKTCTSDTECGMNGSCQDKRCVCDAGSAMNDGQCLPICTPRCNPRQFCQLNPGPNTCECRPGFEPSGPDCEVGKIVLNTFRQEYTLSTGEANKKFSVPPGVDPDQIVPFLSARATEQKHDSSLVSVSIAPNGLTLQRSAGLGSVTVVANLVEFDPRHVKVTHGQTKMNDGKKVPNGVSPVSNIDPTHFFLVFYERYQTPIGQGVALQNSVSVIGEVTPNGIQFHREVSKGAVFIDWFLVESIGDAFEVSHENIDIAKNAFASSPIPNRSDSEMLLWSGETAGMGRRESNAICTINSMKELICNRAHLSVPTNAAEPSKVLKMNVQSIVFQNSANSVVHIPPLTTAEASSTGIVSNLNDLKKEDTLIVGQLGRAGATLVGAFSNGVKDAPGSQSLCTVEFDNKGAGVEALATRAGHRQTEFSVAPQWIRWY